MYISQKGIGVDYLGFYHFLEGLVNYSKWPEMIDYRTKHKRLIKKPFLWTDKNKIKEQIKEPTKLTAVITAMANIFLSTFYRTFT